MAVTFVKDAKGKVIVTSGKKKYSLDPSMNIIPHPADEKVIIITDSSAPLEQREVLKFGHTDVTVPTSTDRDNLIEKLGQDFFNGVIVEKTGDDGAPTSVEQDDESVTIVEANANRVEVFIRNDSEDPLYLEYGEEATTDSAIKLLQDDVLIEDKYTGIITGIWGASGSGNARITEITI